MNTPDERGRPRSGVGLEPDRPAVDGDRSPPVPSFAADVIRRRPSGERPPLPKNLRGAARFWLVMIAILAMAPVLGLSAAGGTGGYVDQINHAVRNLLENVDFPGFTALMGAVNVLGSVWILGILRWGTLATLVIYRRWQHLLAFAGSVLMVAWVVNALTPPVSSPLSPQSGVVVRRLWVVAGNLAPSPAVAGLAVTVVGIAFALGTPGRPRRLSILGGGVLLAALGVARMYRGNDLSSVLTGTILGVAIPLVLFRLLAPEGSFPVSYRRGKSAHLSVEGLRGEAIRRALADQLGIIVVEAKPFGTAGSGGSTPLRLRVAGEPQTDLFGKLYAVNHLRSDRWYKLGRMILYGALEDEKPFNSVRRLVEYEDYMLRLMADVGVPSAGPYGFVELTPEREYLLVTEFLTGGEEILDAEVGRDTVRGALSVVRRLWTAGIAHRDVKPSNLLVRDGKVYLIDVAFCQVRPSPWRQAVDLANMMLVLALRTSPRLVYEEALGLFAPEDIAEAFAATRGVTIPSQLRAEIRKDGRDLLGAFRELAPGRASIRIQRWSLRRFGVTVGALVGGVIAVSLLWGNLTGAGLR